MKLWFICITVKRPREANKKEIHCPCLVHVYWDRILGRNWDKSLKCFAPCYSQSPLPSTNGYYSLSKVVWNWFVIVDIVYGNFKIKLRNFKEIVRSWIRLLYMNRQPNFKGTQEWEFFWLRFWIVYYFIVSYA